MSITINLEPEKEALLQERAARLGRNANEYLHDIVLERLDKPEPELLLEEVVQLADTEPTLAELFAGRTGLVDSKGQFNYSDHTGKAYTESLLKQRTQKTNTKEG